MDRYLVEDKNFLGDRLRELRLIFGFRQADVADVLNVSRSTYSYYETGATRPDPAVLAQLANCYDIPIECFFVDFLEDPLTLRDPGKSRPYPQGASLGDFDPTRIGELLPLERRLILLLRSNGYFTTEQILDEVEDAIAARRRQVREEKKNDPADKK